MEEVTITVDGRSIKVPRRSVVLRAARRLGIDIPALCYHDAVSPYGACRLCLVEVTLRGRTRIVTSCTYPAEEGLEVRTDTERVLRLRRGVAELLLARCPEGWAADEGSRRLLVDSSPKQIIAEM